MTHDKIIANQLKNITLINGMINVYQYVRISILQRGLIYYNLRPCLILTKSCTDLNLYFVVNDGHP